MILICTNVNTTIVCFGLTELLYQLFVLNLSINSSHLYCQRKTKCKMSFSPSAKHFQAYQQWFREQIPNQLRSGLKYANIQCVHTQTNQLKSDPGVTEVITCFSELLKQQGLNWAPCLLQAKLYRIFFSFLLLLLFFQTDGPIRVQEQR